MYPRNASSPPPIACGEVVQISDGAVQTTGASVRVKTGTGSWAAGGGTLACDTTSGEWTYSPTQAETDAESFLVKVYKANCHGCGVTVCTTASATAGYGGLDWGKVANKTTTNALTGTTISGVNVTQVAGSSAAADNLKQSLLAMATGAVVADGSNSATSFKVDTTLGAKSTDYFGNSNGGLVLAFVSGAANEFQSRRVVAFNTTTDFITVEEAFNGAPSDADAFVLLGRITELS